jgi:hypothetical protein
MKHIRNWLMANKVLFETVAAVLLSVMAIIVSVAQYKTTSEQTNLLSLQTRISEAQALPQFELAIHQVLNDATRKFDDDHLVVTNRGGPIHDFSSNSAYFLIVTSGGAHGEFVKNEVAVSGYFTASFISVSSTGVLVTMTGNHNNATFAALTRAVQEAAQSKHLDFGALNEHLVVRLRYRDLLDRPHEDYYEARPVSGGTRITDEIGKAEFSRWSEAPPKELSDIRVEDLLKNASGDGTP